MKQGRGGGATGYSERNERLIYSATQNAGDRGMPLLSGWGKPEIRKRRDIRCRIRSKKRNIRADQPKISPKNRYYSDKIRVFVSFVLPFFHPSIHAFPPQSAQQHTGTRVDDSRKRYPPASCAFPHERNRGIPNPIFKRSKACPVPNPRA